ncbi:MAG: aerobic carbon-monoxide dehydrogenase medium subunit [Chloroflexota bacterium]|jgi:carbon-monoxide dehydrogenase medium subunit|nr:aerobic carbon-monoxide dehydrogenase medium subunit [Chloroflexota bacterium]
MYPPSFEYHVATSFADATQLLVDLEGAKLLAGGCSLIPLMKFRLAQPPHLVDLNRIPGARYVIEDDGVLRIGALTRESEVERSAVVLRRYPILAEVSAVIADPLVRNMGTIGGNLAHGDPANDHPAAMLALGAELLVQGREGMRTIPCAAFFLDLFETALQPDEVVVEIRIPAPAAGSGAAYVKFERQVGDFAIAGAAVNLRLADGRIRDAAISLTNAGPVPSRMAAAEDALNGSTGDPGTLEAAARLAAAGCEPWTDLRGSVTVKRQLAGVAVKRAVTAALARARGGPHA